MLTIIAIVLAVLVVPSPWGLLLVVGAAVADVLETVLCWSWSQRRRAVVGIETMVGRTAVAVTALAPGGQVRVDGERWAARSQAGTLAPGEAALVVAVDGLTLVVERL